MFDHGMMKNMMSIDSTNLKNDEVREQLIARGTLYKLFSLGFNFTSDELLPLINNSEYQEVIRESPKVLKSIKLSKAAKLFLESASKANIHELKKDYNRIFIAKPMMTLFGEEYGAHVFSKVHQMADIVGFYKAFDIKQPKGERVDNICLELEFMYVLINKELFAVENGWKEKAEICHKAESTFIGDHILGWYEIFAEKFTKLSEQEFYRNLALFLREFISFEKKYLNAKESVIKDIGPNNKISKQIDLITEKAGCDDDLASTLEDAPNF